MVNSEHFYYVPGSGILARSQGITPAQVAECQHLAPLPMIEGAAGLFRGETTAYILGVALANAIHYVFLPKEALDVCAWNLKTLHLVDQPVPPDLPLLALRDLTPPNMDEQLAVLRSPFVEGLLAALIQEVPLAIVNCPPDQRILLIQGLLYRLPMPARWVTFATHADDRTPTQIKFVDKALPGYCVYDWAQKNLFTTPPQDAYSRYIATLNPAEIVQQVDHFTRAANWEKLPEEGRISMLTWLARRVQVDQALQTKQTVNPRQVGAILYHDPTLPTVQRLQYSTYLLDLGLKGDLAAADILPDLASTNPELNQALIRALKDMEALAAIRLLSHWVANVPNGNLWVQPLHQRTLQYIEKMLEKHDFSAAAQFIRQGQFSESTANTLLEMVKETAFHHAELAQATFIMAAKSLPLTGFQNLSQESRLTRHLPESTQVALNALLQSRSESVPLAQAAAVFAESERQIILMRLVEWAVASGQPQLVDGVALRVLVNSADLSLITGVVNELSRPERLITLDLPTLRGLIQLFLKSLRFQDAIDALAFYQTKTRDRLKEFARMAGEAYLLTSLTNEQMEEAVALLEGSKISPEVRAMIYCGALKNQQWADDQISSAHRLTELIFNSPAVVPLIGLQNTTDLLDLHGRQKDSESTLKIAVGIVANALEMGSRGATLLVKIWDSITFEPRIARSALELLRRYIRGVNPEEAEKLPAYFAKELGSEVGDALQATYYLRQIIPDGDLIGFFAELHTLTGMLLYLQNMFKGALPHTQLERNLGSMTASLTSEERRQVGENLRQVIQSISEQKRTRGKADVPSNGIEFLQFMSAHFGQTAKKEPVKTTFTFAGHSLLTFHKETEAMLRLMKGLAAVPTKSLVKPTALAAELDSLWKAIDEHEQQAIQTSLVEDSAALAQLLGLLSDQGDNRATRQIELNQRQPQNVMEALRWISGYFMRG